VSKTEDDYAAGLEIRRKMFGTAGADEQIAAANEFTRPLQDFVTRQCFGETWTRPHLDHKTRSLITLAILTSLGRQNQVRTHVQGAIANGVSKEEIREVLMHTVIYAGLPASVDSFRAASEVFKQMGLD
jgi:4-carboxymuconolactone decarboxylase